jgi:hypothetical protein
MFGNILKAGMGIGKKVAGMGMKAGMGMGKKGLALGKAGLNAAKPTSMTGPTEGGVGNMFSTLKKKKKAPGIGGPPTV